MTLKVKREENDNKGVVITTSDYESCMVVVCEENTSEEHNAICNELKMELNTSCKVDLYFTRSMTSIFIFDAETLNATNDDIKQIIPDVMHNTVYKGSVYGRKIRDLLVTRSNSEIRVSKKWKTLLTVKRG